MTFESTGEDLSLAGAQGFAAHDLAKDESLETRAVRYRVGLTKNIGGDVEAWVFDAPGCWTVASSLSSLAPVLPVVIAEHLAWLRRHGEKGGDDVSIEVDIAEEIDATREAEVCFVADCEPVTPSELETGIRRMGFARTDLLDAVRGLPPLVLDWRPPLSAAARTDSWALEMRTIREILAHIASAEWSYRTALMEQPRPGEPEEELRDLDSQRERSIDHLRALTAEDRARTFRSKGRRSGVEEWTVRKALRRYVCHERFHTREIQQRLTWLILGIPSISGQPHREGP